MPLRCSATSRRRTPRATAGSASPGWHPGRGPRAVACESHAGLAHAGWRRRGPRERLRPGCGRRPRHRGVAGRRQWRRSRPRTGPSCEVRRRARRNPRRCSARREGLTRVAERGPTGVIPPGAVDSPSAMNGTAWRRRVGVPGLGRRDGCALVAARGLGDRSSGGRRQVLGRGTLAVLRPRCPDLDRGRFRVDRGDAIAAAGARSAARLLLAEILHRESIRRRQARSPPRHRRLGGSPQGFELRRSVFRGSLLRRSSRRG